MALILIALFLIIGFLAYNNNLIKSNYFIYFLIVFLMIMQILILNIETYRIIITIASIFLLFFFIKRNKIATFKFVYILTIFIATLGFLSYKNQEYSNANNYINSEIIAKVIPQELQNSYLEYLAIVGYDSNDLVKYIDFQKENLQKELNVMTLFEKFEFYNYSKDYIQMRHEYYTSIQETAIEEIDNEIIYYESLSESTKSEYQQFLDSKIKELIE